MMTKRKKMQKTNKSNQIKSMTGVIVLSVKRLETSDMIVLSAI